MMPGLPETAVLARSAAAALPVRRKPVRCPLEVPEGKILWGGKLERRLRKTSGLTRIVCERRAWDANKQILGMPLSPEARKNMAVAMQAGQPELI